MKQGFTLIELLAVIVILAVIALIATPIILNIIEDARKQSAKSSAELYVDGLIKQIASKNMINEFNPSSCTISNGNVTCDGIELGYQANGKIPTSGTITLNNGKIDSYLLTFDEYKVTKNGDTLLVSNANDKPCRVTDGSSSIDTETAITCGTEKFHVISVNSNTARLLTDENITLSTTNPVQTTTFTPTYFSDTIYWYDEQNYTFMPNYITNTNTTYIYDSNSNLYRYVEAYKNTLSNLGITVIKAELIRESDLDSMPLYSEDIRTTLVKFDDSIGTDAINDVGLTTILETLTAAGAEDLYHYSLLTDLEKAKLYELTLLTLENEGLSNASDQEKLQFFHTMIQETNSNEHLPYWMYNGKYYYAGFAGSDCVSYPWKGGWDGGANYNNTTEYSIRPVVEIPISDIKH